MWIEIVSTSVSNPSPPSFICGETCSNVDSHCVHNASIRVVPHLPPSGHRWGHGWEFHVVNDLACGAKCAFKWH